MHKKDAFLRRSSLEPIASPVAIEKAASTTDLNTDIQALLPTNDKKKENIQSYISQIFENEKKYEKKVAHRDDLVQTNSLIFDMNKFGEVNVTRN